MDKFANERIDLSQAELGSALEIAPNELVLAYSHFQSYGASIFRSRCPILLGERENSLHAAYTELPLLVINMVADGVDLSAGVFGSPEQLRNLAGTPRGKILFLEAITTAFLPHVLAQQLAAFGIEDANEKFVPLHVD